VFDGSEHFVPAQGVEGVLPINLDSDTAWVSGHASAQGVPNNLAASADAYGHL
jgi:hypothetical protein